MLLYTIRFEQSIDVTANHKLKKKVVRTIKNGLFRGAELVAEELFCSFTSNLFSMEKIKQMFHDRRFWGVLISIVVMAVVAVAYFYPDDVQGNVLRQHDMQQGAAIGQEAKAYAEATGVQSRWTGALFSGMPTFQISPSYPSNSLFGWINSVMGLGLPEPANLLMMMMLGFFILLMSMKMKWYVSLIGAIAYGFSSYFIIIIGAGHLWKFITLAYVPPTIAGIVLCYRGRYLLGGAVAALFAMMQIASNHVQMTYYFMFVIVGVVVAYLVSAIRSGRMRGWLVGTATLAVAAVLAVGANLPNLYYTYEYSKESMRGGHSELARANAGGEKASAGLDRDYITQYSYAPSETFTLLIPNVKGGASNKPEKGEQKIMSLSSLDAAKDMVNSGAISSQEAAYLDYMSQYFGDPEGTNGPVYVGALIVALFVLGCVIVRGPLKWALIVLTVFSILLAFGRHFMSLTDFMIDYMPMYSKFRTVESILVIAEFTMPLLAAMALQQIFGCESGAEAWKRYRKPILWSFGVVMAFCLLGIVAPSIYGDVVVDRDRQVAAMITQSLSAQGVDSQTIQYFSLNNPRIYGAVEALRNSMIEADAMRSFLFVGAGLGVLLLYFFGKLSLCLSVVGVGIVVCCDLFMVNKRYLNTDSFLPKQLVQGEMFPLSDADRFILADTTSNYRVMDIPRFWSAAPSYHHKTIGGYHAAKLARYQDIIDRHLNPFLEGTQGDADWNVLNMLNARYIVDMTGQPMLNPEAMGNAWFVDRVDYVKGADAEMAALDALDPMRAAVADEKFRAALGTSQSVTPGDTIRLTSYAPDRLTYSSESARGGVAVFSEVYFPWGWKATVDGAPVEIGRVNYILRAINLPAGKHTVEMTFDPDSLRATTGVAYTSIIVIYLLLAGAVVLNVARKRKTIENESNAKLNAEAKE